MTANNTDSRLFKEEDLEELMRHIYIGKGYSMEKPTKKIFLELAQSFVEEVLDLPASEKMSLTKEAIEKQIRVKFPEISRKDPNIEIAEKRNKEIEKEDIY